GAWNEYDGDHFGEVLWSEQGHIPHEHRYYFNNGKKRDFNTYAKVNYQISDRFNAFVDLQYRTINYKVAGTDNDLSDATVSDNFDFFNPKAGLTFALNDRTDLYASYAVANREPVRDDYLDFEGS